MRILNIPRHVPSHWSGMPPIAQQVESFASGDTLAARYTRRSEEARTEAPCDSKVAGILANNDEQRRIADQRLIDALREHGPMTRGALQKVVGLSSSNVCCRVKRLMESGTIVERDGFPRIVGVAE